MMTLLITLPLLLFGVWVLGQRVDSLFEPRPPSGDATPAKRSAVGTPLIDRFRNGGVRTVVAPLLAVPLTAFCLANLDRAEGGLRLASLWNGVALALMALGISSILIEIARQTWRRRSKQGVGDEAA